MIDTIIDHSAPRGSTEPIVRYVNDKVVVARGFGCDWESPDGYAIDPR